MNNIFTNSIKYYYHLNILSASYYLHHHCAMLTKPISEEVGIIAFQRVLFSDHLNLFIREGYKHHHKTIEHVTHNHTSNTYTHPTIQLIISYHLLVIVTWCNSQCLFTHQHHIVTVTFQTVTILEHIIYI